jgi:hypothetical protein
MPHACRASNDLAELHATEPWHRGICQNDVWQECMELMETIGGIAGNHDVKGIMDKGSFNNLLNGTVIFNQ